MAGGTMEAPLGDNITVTWPIYQVMGKSLLGSLYNYSTGLISEFRSHCEILFLWFIWQNGRLVITYVCAAYGKLLSEFNHWRHTYRAQLSDKTYNGTLTRIIRSGYRPNSNRGTSQLYMGGIACSGQMAGSYSNMCCLLWDFHPYKNFDVTRPYNDIKGLLNKTMAHSHQARLYTYKDECMCPIIVLIIPKGIKWQVGISCQFNGRRGLHGTHSCNPPPVHSG